MSEGKLLARSWALDFHKRSVDVRHAVRLGTAYLQAALHFAQLGRSKTSIACSHAFLRQMTEYTLTTLLFSKAATWRHRRKRLLHLFTV